MFMIFGSFALSAICSFAVAIWMVGKLVIVQVINGGDAADHSGSGHVDDKKLIN